MFFATGEGYLALSLLLAWVLSWLLARIAQELTGVRPWPVFLVAGILFTIAGLIAGPRRAYAFTTALRHIGPLSLGLAFGLVLSSWFVVRRITGSSPRATFSALSLGVVLGASALATTVYLRADAGERLGACVASPSAYSIGGGEGLWYGVVPNLFLYIPVGVAITANWPGRPLPQAVASAAALSVVIEIYQATFTTRSCSPTDTVTNALGALIGAVLLTALTRRRSRPIRTSASNSAGDAG